MAKQPQTVHAVKTKEGRRRIKPRNLAKESEKMKNPTPPIPNSITKKETRNVVLIAQAHMRRKESRK
jgi:hypothetical protein